MTFIPRPQEIYKHFKGNLYQIVAIAEHSETGEQLVIYQALYGDFRIYARPLPMFTSTVDHAKYPEVKQKFRFALQGPESHRQERETQPNDAADHESTKTVAEILTESGAEEADTQATDMEETEELTLDPIVLEFLDADTYEQRLNILASLHHRITDEMITTMAIACDIEVNEGTLEERYEALKGCLLTLEKYECNRMR